MVEDCFVAGHIILPVAVPPAPLIPIGSKKLHIRNDAPDLVGMQAPLELEREAKFETPGAQRWINPKGFLVPHAQEREGLVRVTRSVSVLYVTVAEGDKPCDASIGPLQ